MPIRLNKLWLLVVLSACYWGSACNHYYYAPSEGQSLSLSEQHDAKISAGFGGGSSQERGKSFNLQVGYSPLKHLGLQANYFTLSRGDVDSESQSGNGRLFEGAIGGYYFFPKEVTDPIPEGEERLFVTPGILVDFYVSYGDGFVHNNYDAVSSSRFDFKKYYVQSGIHWYSKSFGVAYMFRGGVLDFEEGLVSGDIDPSHVKDFEAINSTDPFTNFESTLRVEGGIRKARIFFSQTWLHNTSNKAVEFIENVTQVGMVLELDELFRDKKK